MEKIKQNFDEVSVSQDFEFDARRRKDLQKGVSRILKVDSDIANTVVSRLQSLYGMRLEDQGVFLPENKKMQIDLAVKLQNAINSDQPLMVMSGGCPDYSFGHDGQYNFETLNDGVGLNVSDLFERGKHFLRGLKQLGVNCMHTIYYADVEGLDAEVVQGLGISQNEFIDRVAASAEAARDFVGQRGCEPGVEVKIDLMSNALSEEDLDLACKIGTEINRDTIAGLSIDLVDMYSKLVSDHSLIFNQAYKDSLRYISFGVMARRRGAVILGSSHPKLMSMYNQGGDLPKTPLVRVG